MKRLATLPRALVASPGYLRRGAPREPKQLVEHRGVRFSSQPCGDGLELLGPSGAVVTRLPATFTSNNALVLREALLAGAGIGAMPLWLVHEALRKRQLARVLPDHALADSELNAVYPSGRFVPERARRFAEYVAAGLRGTPGIDLQA